MKTNLTINNHVRCVSRMKTISNFTYAAKRADLTVEQDKSYKRVLKLAAAMLEDYFRTNAGRKSTMRKITKRIKRIIK